MIKQKNRGGFIPDFLLFCGYVFFALYNIEKKADYQTRFTFFCQRIICKKFVLEEPSFGSSCEKNDDCDDSNLECNNKICTLIEGSTAITLSDNGNSFYYCPNNNLFAKIDTDGTNKCVKRENDEMNGLCKLKSNSGVIKIAYPDYMKVCGEIVLATEDKNYAHLKTTVNSIGTVTDGKFVEITGISFAIASTKTLGNPSKSEVSIINFADL